MHIDLGTALIVAALVSALVLLASRSDRVFPIVAVIAASIQALMAFGVLTLTLARFRVDVILPALLVVAGAACWGKAGRKSEITAATIVTLVGGMQLLLALRVFD